MKKSAYRNRRDPKGVRDAIIKNAIVAFSSNGMEKVSIQHLADQSGISQTTVLHHFKSKDILVEAAILSGVNHCRDLVAQSFEVEDNAYDRLIRYGDVNCNWAFRFRDEANLVVMLYYLAAVDRHFSDIYTNVRLGAQKRIREFLLAGIREGIFSSHVESNTHEILHDFIMGSILNAVTQGKSGRLEHSVKRKWRMIVQTMTGYSKSKT